MNLPLAIENLHWIRQVRSGALALGYVGTRMDPRLVTRFSSEHLIAQGFTFSGFRWGIVGPDVSIRLGRN